MSKKKDLYNHLEWTSQEFNPFEKTPTSKKAHTKPLISGTRVAFIGDLECLLSYRNPPFKGALGTVIKVRKANSISSNPLTVHVKWDSGVVSEVFKDHLNTSKTIRTASNFCKKFASIDDMLVDFIKVASEPDLLIHKATEDYWSLGTEGDGFVLERLFDEEGSPLTK